MVAIKDYKLQGFISDTNSQPLKYLIQEDQTHDKINPDFLDWKQQDLFKLINGSFFSFIFHSFMYRVYIEGNHHSKNGKEWYKERMI